MSDKSAARVLLADNESKLVELYAKFLDSRYDVRTATSGEEALEKVDETVDVALLDRRMPEMSGDEVLGEIRKRGIDVRVAMLTAVEPDVDIVDMPFDDYKIKPVDKDDLIGVVEVLLERNTYDKQSQQFFSLASKKASLELAGKDNTTEYEQLVDKIDEIRGEIDETLESVGAKAAFADLPSDPK